MHSHPADARDANARTFDLKIVVGQRKAVVLEFLLELRIAEVLGILEDVLDGFYLVLDAVLHGALGNLQHPMKFSLFYSVVLPTKCGFVGFGKTRILLVRLILLLPLLKRPVVGKPGNAAGSRKIVGLSFVRIKLCTKSQLKGRHSSIFAACTALFMPSISFWFFLLREP